MPLNKIKVSDVILRERNPFHMKSPLLNYCNTLFFFNKDKFNIPEGRHADLCCQLKPYKGKMSLTFVSTGCIECNVDSKSVLTSVHFNLQNKIFYKVL